MIRFIHASLILILSLAIILPLSLSTPHKFAPIFVWVIATFTYIYKFIKSKKILLAFLSSTISAIFFSLAFWVLYHLHFKLHLKYSFFFILTFFGCFVIVGCLMLFMKKSKASHYVIAFLNIAAISAFVLLLVFSKTYQASLGHAILLGFLIGFVVASISSYLFESLIYSSSKIFGGLTDYIAILLKPFLIFFIGYLSIALMFAGLYNVLYICRPDSLFIPQGQVSLLDLIVYSLDTMTTGGNSAVEANSTLAQTINTFNVFSAIIWMTVMLAATIAYTSESFMEVSKKHKGKKGGSGEDRPFQETIKPF